MQITDIFRAKIVDVQPKSLTVEVTGSEDKVDKLLDLLKRNFRSVRHVKPPASRDESVELYLLAKDFKGRGESGGEG